MDSLIQGLDGVPRKSGKAALRHAPGRPAVFLDRDGTLNEEIGYLHRPEDLRWTPGAPSAVRLLNEANWLVLVITNQAGIAKGYYTEDDVHLLHAHMQAQLSLAGAHIDAFYFSPYHPEASIDRYRRASPCRKPGTDLFTQAIAEWGVDPSRSVAIGDKASDLVPGRLLGMRTILVETGYGRDALPCAVADDIAPDFATAADRILWPTSP